MSWEEMSVDKHPCPCGKSTFSVTHRMDDWNRTDASMNMDCEHCRKDYVLFSENSYRSGLPSVAQFWISKQTKAECDRSCNEACSARLQAQTLRTQRYLSQWNALFEGKNKKQAWEILTNKGARYPALGTFYQHTKVEGIVAYLERHFESADDRTFKEILKILNIEDREIIGLMDRALALEQEARNLVWQERFPQ